MLPGTRVDVLLRCQSSEIILLIPTSSKALQGSSWLVQVPSSAWRYAGFAKELGDKNRSLSLPFSLPVSSSSTWGNREGKNPQVLISGTTSDMCHSVTLVIAWMNLGNISPSRWDFLQIKGDYRKNPPYYLKLPISKVKFIFWENTYIGFMPMKEYAGWTMWN